MPRQGKCSQTPLSAVPELSQLPALVAPSFWGWGCRKDWDRWTGRPVRGRRPRRPGFQGRPSGKVFEAAQTQLWEAWEGATPVGELVQGSMGASTAGSGRCSKHLPDAAEPGMGRAHGPPTGTGRRAMVARSGWGEGADQSASSWLPQGCPFPLELFTCSLAAHLTRVPCAKKQPQSCQQEEAEEAGEEKLEQDREPLGSWQPPAGRGVPGGAGNARSALFCLLPGWPQPHHAWPLLQPSSHFPRLTLPTLARGEPLPEKPPGTGVRSPGPSPSSAPASCVTLVSAGGGGEDGERCAH